MYQDNVISRRKIHISNNIKYNSTHKNRNIYIDIFGTAASDQIRKFLDKFD